MSTIDSRFGNYLLRLRQAFLQAAAKSRAGNRGGSGRRRPPAHWARIVTAQDFVIAELIFEPISSRSEVEICSLCREVAEVYSRLWKYALSQFPSDFQLGVKYRRMSTVLGALASKASIVAVHSRNQSVPEWTLHDEIVKLFSLAYKETANDLAVSRAELQFLRGKFLGARFGGDSDSSKE